MIKIAISGKANSGKNTLSKLLIKEIQRRDPNFDYYVQQIAFADPIKKIVKTMFPNVKKKHLFGSSKFRNEIIPNAYKNGIPLTIRQALIDIGTSAREYNDNIWIDHLKETLLFDSNYEIEGSIFIVPDLRFKNEFDFLKELKFFFVRINRKESQLIDHVSESLQDQITDSNFDYVISNNGSLNDLKNEAFNVVNKLNK